MVNKIASLDILSKFGVGFNGLPKAPHLNAGKVSRITITILIGAGLIAEYFLDKL